MQRFYNLDILLILSGHTAFGLGLKLSLLLLSTPQIRYIDMWVGENKRQDGALNMKMILEQHEVFK